MNIFKTLTLALTLAAGLCHAAPPAPVPEETAVMVTSEPPGASVSIDGVNHGLTPLTITTLTPGTHAIKLTLRDYEPLFDNLTVHAAPVGSGMAAAPQNASFKLAPVTGIVLVQSFPAGATVTRDGANAGITPVLLTELPIGRYRVDVSLGGYKPQQFDLSVQDGKPQRISAELVSSSAMLKITSEPNGAAVTLNGIFRGETPCDIDRVTEGQSVLEVAAPGYAPYKEQVQVSAGETYAMHIPLAPIPSTLNIVSIPDGARVYIDNQYKGDTPYKLENTAAGTYRIRVEKDAYDPMARTVTVDNNDTVTEEFRLVANVGSLRVITAPANVDILINGRLYGTTGAAENETDQISQPLVIDNIPTGDHEVTFSRKGYAAEIRAATIARGDTVNLDTVTLARMFIPDIEIVTRAGAFKGVFISRDTEFYRIETSPGVIRRFAHADIVSRRLIQDKNREDDINQ